MSKKKNGRITIAPDLCTGCLRCALACSFFTSPEKTFNLSNSRITVLPGYDLRQFEIAFKDACDQCGICVQYCEFGALNRKKNTDKIIEEKHETGVADE
ncbi:MAG: hypothetical protein FP814_10275 [Desulfobacterium sp.]|nr:hypothetical protein [Desulfobacterium sp.]MBU3948772.1 4Fe-4S binding protein [Pseudomonadota bacterium]MBU4037142.1 4Fe-4S binding protein [Pseudomonadota bacterium]